jgi:hypothetical protein
MRELASREADRERRVYSFATVRPSLSQGLAGSRGWLFTKVESDFDCRTTCDLHGPALQSQPGVNGGQHDVGYARIFGETGRHERFLVTLHLGLGTRDALLHTRRDSSLGPPG